MEENKNSNTDITRPDQIQPNTTNDPVIQNSVISPSSDDTVVQIPPHKPSKWRFLFIILGVLQVLGIAIFLLAIFWGTQQAKAGVSGTEFIALILFVTLVPTVGFIALINLIGLPIYLRKHKPQEKGKIFGILSIIISAILVLFGGFIIFQSAITVPKQMKQSDAKLQQQIKAQDNQFATDNAKPEITKDEAIQLLKSCKLKGFYYTNQTNKSDPSNGGWGELSSTGVVLTKVDGQPYRISIADRLIPELVPVAREAQKTCSDLQFWHDGNYEQKQADGTWH